MPSRLTWPSAALLGLAVVFGNPAAHAQEAADLGGALWLDDYDTAVKVGKREGKDLLVNFTGSDWCPWCKKLDAEVLAKPEFTAAVSQHFVLLTLDYPRSPQLQARLPNPKRNAQIQSRYAVTEFPTVILMTTKGDAYARTGYRKGGWKPYSAHLDQLRTRNRKQMRAAHELAGAFAASKGPERFVLLQAGLRQMSRFPIDAPYADVLIPLAREAAAPEGPTVAPRQDAQILALANLMRLARSTTEEEERARKLDVKGKLGLLELAVDAQCRRSKSKETVAAALTAIANLEKIGIQDKQLAARLFVNAAHWHEGIYRDEKTAAKWAQKAFDLVGAQPAYAELFQRLLNQTD
jgi:thiol-disulfide isomerase/thioredoxin